MDSKTYHGSCFCGSVVFSATGAPEGMVQFFFFFFFFFFLFFFIKTNFFSGFLSLCELSKLVSESGQRFFSLEAVCVDRLQRGKPHQNV